MGKSLYIATPTMSGDVCYQYCESVIQTIVDLNRRGVACSVPAFCPGNCYVSMARNMLVSQFMATPCTDLLFIDADMGWQPDAAWRLLQHDREIVAGLYRYKIPEESYPGWLYTGADERPLATGGLLRMDTAPTGFMRISRAAIERMIAAYPERELARKDGAPRIWDFFGTERVERTWWGDDTRFCQLFQQAGGTIWADPDLTFVHVGRVAFEGNFHAFMKRQPGGVDDPAREAA